MAEVRRGILKGARVCEFGVADTREARHAEIRAGRDGVRLENGIYGHSRFCNTDFDDKLACLNLSGV
ncbi:hypothetical protein FOT49_10805 [Citrobacter freundii]|nr:hypothetical protein [Citrobacter freundii]